MRYIIIFSIFIFTAAFVHAQDAVTYYDEGVKLKNDKRSAAAIDKFKKAIQLRPGYIEAMYEMGWCQNDTKDYTAAMATLRNVRGVWTTIPKVYFETAYAFEKSSMYDSAIYFYNKTLDLKADYTAVHKQLGTIAYLKDDHEKALMHYAKHEATEMSKGKIVGDYLYWYRKGFSQNALKQYENAKESLNKSLSYKTDYINTYLELGFACARLKQNDEAIGFYKKAMDIDPQSHVPYNGIAEVYRDNKKDMNEAISWYNKALEVKPDERKANFGIGYCFNSQAKYSEAIPYLQKAIQQEATYTAAYVELGYSYYMTSNNSDALKQFDKALSLNSKNENARYYAGLVYISQKNKSKAQQMVDELKVLNSKNASTLQDKVNKM